MSIAGMIPCEGFDGVLRHARLEQERIQSLLIARHGVFRRVYSLFKSRDAGNDSFWREGLSVLKLLVHSSCAPIGGEKIQKNQNARDGCHCE